MTDRANTVTAYLLQQIELLAEAQLPNVHTESTMDGAAAKVVELAAAP